MKNKISATMLAGLFALLIYLSLAETGCKTVAPRFGNVAQVIVGDEEEGNAPRTDIGFALPKEGFTIAFDEMVIAKDASRADLAYAFINYIYDGEVAAANMDYICGPNPVKPGIEAPDPDNRDLIVLSPEQLTNGQVLRGFADKPEVMALYNKAWDRIKATDSN